MARKMEHPNEICAMCGKSKNQVLHLMQGVYGYVCDQCIEEGHEMLSEYAEQERRLREHQEHIDATPSQIKSYGFKLVADGNNNPWFQHSPQRDIPISPVDYNSYKCNGGEWFRIEFEFASTVQATTTDNYGANTYVNINIGLYGIKTNGASCWFIPFGGRSNSSGTVQKVSTAVQLDSDVRSFSVCIQCAGSGTFSGTLKIRNVSVYRMMGNELIVDGAITAAKIRSGEVTSDKIAANAITSDKISVSQLSAISADLGSITGGSINIGNGKFKVDSSGNFTATNGSLTGIVNATTMRAKQNYSVYSDTFDTYQKIIEWSGQSGLNIGLIGDGKTSGASGAHIILYGSTVYCYDDLSVLLNLSVGKKLVAETISANSIDATAIYTNNKNTSMGVNLYTSGTLTVKSGTTLKSTLHVDGESGFYGKVTARNSFAFLDYNAEEDANATAVFRRPIASAGSNKTKVAFLQSHAGKAVNGTDTSKFGKSVSDNAKALKEWNLSDTDFRYAFETDGIQKGEDQINTLVQAALDAGVISDTSASSVANLASMLAELGVISSSTGSSLDEAADSIGDISERIDKASAALTGIQKAESVLDAQSTGKSLSLDDFNSDELADYTSALEYNNGALNNIGGISSGQYFTNQDKSNMKNSNSLDTGYNPGHLKGYAKGTKHVGSNRIAMTNENGREIIVTKDGWITPLEASDMVIPNDITETLIDMAERQQNYAMNGNFKMPELKVKDASGNSVNNVYNTFTVQGDLTRDTLPELNKILDLASSKTQNDIRKNKRRFG